MTSHLSAALAAQPKPHTLDGSTSCTQTTAAHAPARARGGRAVRRAPVAPRRPGSRPTQAQVAQDLRPSSPWLRLCKSLSLSLAIPAVAAVRPSFVWLVCPCRTARLPGRALCALVCAWRRWVRGRLGVSPVTCPAWYESEGLAASAYLWMCVLHVRLRKGCKFVRTCPHLIPTDTS